MCAARAGLFRVIAWVLNGLQLRVRGADVSSTPDGMARNTFWVTDTQGHKLKAAVGHISHCDVDQVCVIWNDMHATGIRLATPRGGAYARQTCGRPAHKRLKPQEYMNDLNIGMLHMHRYQLCLSHD